MKTILFLIFVISFVFYLGFNILNAKERTTTIDQLQSKNSNPVELGHVDWLRNFDEAKAKAVKEKKLLLVFFQEVPGCSTASGYGKRVMTHPLIIEAVENLFVPVAIYNNIGGHDREILNSFNEPSWNNPVVRIITPDGKALAPRLNGDYTRLGLVNSMITALRNNNEEVPEYLVILEKELSVNKTVKDKAIFSMYCFWSGESGLGKIEGVISTEPGFMGGREVVEVEYNSSIISYEKLLKTAKSKNISKYVFTRNEEQHKVAGDVLGPGSVSDSGSFRPDDEPKYYMSKTHYRYVPMTGLQASLVNSAIGHGVSPDRYLSPRQLELYSVIRANSNLPWKSAIGSKEFADMWIYAVNIAEDGKS
ncbi:MAG: VPGUxxT family thioredoxin-like (seleno)protein, type 2 [Thermodesulfobacteriota bacterium]